MHSSFLKADEQLETFSDCYEKSLSEIIIIFLNTCVNGSKVCRKTMAQSSHSKIQCFELFLSSKLLLSSTAKGLYVSLVSFFNTNSCIVKIHISKLTVFKQLISQFLTSGEVEKEETLPVVGKCSAMKMIQKSLKNGIEYKSSFLTQLLSHLIKKIKSWISCFYMIDFFFLISIFFTIWLKNQII